MRGVNRKLLQFMVAIGAMQALLGGGYYLWVGVSGLSVFSDVPLDVMGATLSRIDYMFRALAGVWFALGLLLAYLIPTIEKHQMLFVLVYFALFMMGVGRYVSLAAYGETDGNSIAAMYAELVIPIVMIIWQHLTARTQVVSDGGT